MSKNNAKPVAKPAAKPAAKADLTLTLRLLAADVSHSAGGRRAYLTFETVEGARYGLGIGLDDETQLQMGARELAGAYPELRGLAPMMTVRELFRQQEQFSAQPIEGSLEESSAVSPKTGLPYKNLRLRPKVRNMTEEALNSLFGAPSGDDDMSK